MLVVGVGEDTQPHTIKLFRKTAVFLLNVSDFHFKVFIPYLSFELGFQLLLILLQSVVSEFKGNRILCNILENKQNKPGYTMDLHIYLTISKVYMASSFHYVVLRYCIVFLVPYCYLKNLQIRLSQSDKRMRETGY